jgi:hypothetical protein
MISGGNEKLNALLGAHSTAQLAKDDQHRGFNLRINPSIGPNHHQNIGRHDLPL